MVNSFAPNTEPCGTPDDTGRLRERESPNLVVYVFNVRLELSKGSTGDLIQILWHVQEYIVINSIEGCGEVNECKNSALASIKAAKFIVVYFHKGCFY